MCVSSCLQHCYVERPPHCLRYRLFDARDLRVVGFTLVVTVIVNLSLYLSALYNKQRWLVICC
jgi:hypothetical protein